MSAGGTAGAGAGGGRWGDLRARTLSALAMVVVGGGAIWAGGIAFAALAVLVTGLMIWELAAMTAPARPGNAKLIGLIGAGALAAVLFRHDPFLMPLLALPSMLLTVGARRDKPLASIYALAILLTGYGLVALRQGYGWTEIAWLVALVITSDIAGYFVGRAVGGPKFWPAISPKKTWSGTVAGWVGAGLVGAAFMAFAGPHLLLWLSPVFALAGQMGDIAESWLKRRAGVKDSSTLIPGHGGVLDRFDALIGAVMAVLVVRLVLTAL